MQQVFRKLMPARRWSVHSSCAARRLAEQHRFRLSRPPSQAGTDTPTARDILATDDTACPQRSRRDSADNRQDSVIVRLSLNYHRLPDQRQHRRRSARAAPHPGFRSGRVQRQRLSRRPSPRTRRILSACPWRLGDPPARARLLRLGRSRNRPRPHNPPLLSESRGWEGGSRFPVR